MNDSATQIHRRKYQDTEHFRNLGRVQEPVSVEAGKLRKVILPSLILFGIYLVFLGIQRLFFN